MWKIVSYSSFKKLVIHETFPRKTSKITLKYTEMYIDFSTFLLEMTILKILAYAVKPTADLSLKQNA